MAKISHLPVIDPNDIDGSELLPAVKGGQTGHATLSALAQPTLNAAGLIRDQAADLVKSDNIYIDVDLAAAEAEVAEGTFFKIVDSNSGTAAVFRRGEAGSVLLFREVTAAGLASTDPRSGAALVRLPDGADLRQAIAAAETPADLLASSQPLTVGSTIRTANGFIYKVADAGATDHHLTTAGGVKLYVVHRDNCIFAEAFGVVTGDWRTDAVNPGDPLDCTAQMQAALNALKSRQTLVLPSGTIFTGNLTIQFGKLAVSIVGQGTFIPTSIIQFLPGANDGFQLPHEAYEFRSLHVRGSDEAGSKLFTATRSDGFADMDWSFFDCIFTHADHVGYLKGRGLTVDRCLFGKINDDAFILDHPTQAEFRPGPPDYIQTWEGGFRGFTVRNCRLHNFANHLFRVQDNNRENCRGFTITGNQSDGYARVIKGHAQQVEFSANNWYIGWNSADAVLFDLVGSREINIVGNIISNATNARQIGNEPLVRTTGNVRGLNITGNTFGRRDVPVWDGGTVTDGRAVRDVTIANNVYNDCFVEAPFLARCIGAGGLVQNVHIDENIYESPAGGWTAVVGDSNWRNASIKVRTRHADTIVHNIPNTFSRDNEPKTGSYAGAGAAMNCFVGFPPRSVKIYRNDGILASAKVQSSLSAHPANITFTETGFTVSSDGSVNAIGSVYYWEAM